MIRKLTFISLLILLSLGDLADDNNPGEVSDMDAKPEKTSTSHSSYSLFYASNEYYSFEDSLAIWQYNFKMQVLYGQMRELIQQQSQTQNKETYKKLQTKIDAIQQEMDELTAQTQQIGQDYNGFCGVQGKRAYEGQYIGAVQYSYDSDSFSQETVQDEDVQINHFLVGKAKYSQGVIPCQVSWARQNIWSSYQKQSGGQFWVSWVKVQFQYQSNYTQHLYSAANPTKQSEPDPETTSSGEMSDPASKDQDGNSTETSQPDADGTNRLLMSMVGRPYYLQSFSQWEAQVTGVDQFFAGVNRTSGRITIPEENIDANMLYVVGVELQSNSGALMSQKTSYFNTQEALDIQTFDNNGQFSVAPKNNSKFSEWRQNNDELYVTPEEYVELYSEDFVVTWDVSSEEFNEVDKIYIWVTRGDGNEPQDWISQDNKISNTFCNITNEAKPICLWDSYEDHGDSSNSTSPDLATTDVPPTTAPMNNQRLRFLQQEDTGDQSDSNTTNSTDSETSDQPYTQGMAYINDYTNYFSNYTQQLEIITTNKTGKLSFKTPYPYPGENLLHVGYYLHFNNGTELRAFDWIFIEGAYMGNPFAGYSPYYPYAPPKQMEMSNSTQYSDTMAPAPQAPISKGAQQNSQSTGSSTEVDYGCGAGDLCNNNGVCNFQSMRCKCNPGHYGSKCETALTDAQLKEEQKKNQQAIDNLLYVNITENSEVDSSVRNQIITISSSSILTPDQAQQVMTLLKNTYKKITSLSEGDKYLSGIQNVFRVMDQQSDSSNSTAVTERISQTPSVDMTQADLIIQVTRKMSTMLGSSASVESKHSEFISKVSSVDSNNASTYSVKSVIAINGTTYKGPVYTLPVIANAAGTTGILMNPTITDGLSSIAPSFTIEVTDSNGNVIEVSDSDPITITLCPTDSSIQSNSDLVPAFYDPKTKQLSNKGCSKSATQLSQVCLTFECTHLTTFTLQSKASTTSQGQFSTTTLSSSKSGQSAQASTYGLMLALVSVILIF